MADSDGRVRVAELLASLSLATDLATFQPLGHGLSTSLAAVALATELGQGPDQVRAVQQVALLRFVGCTSDAATAAAMVGGGNEAAHYVAMAPALMGGSAGMLRALAATVGTGQPLHRRIRSMAAVITDTEGLDAHCEVGAMLARRLGLSDGVVFALSHAYERWDGKGHPDGLAGEAIPPEVRIAVVARDVDLFSRAGEDVATVLAQRRGKAYDPAVVDAFARMAPVPGDAGWEDVMNAEPEPPTYLDDLDVALAATADFVDIKSPWTRGHSPRVADLAAGAATLAGLGPAEVRRLRRAALVHDLGRVGVENAIWDKPGPLATGDWEKVRLHSYLTERILSRCPALAGLGDLASSHHERIDGSGYHRAMADDQLPVEGRILAAADVLAALLAARPHRASMGLEAAAITLTAETDEGRLDKAAVGWVVAAAGGTAPQPPPMVEAGGLTPRELEVLRLVARGSTNRLIGEALFISPKTVGRHVENIYAKIGVSTRAGATMHAMENRLLG